MARMPLMGERLKTLNGNRRDAVSNQATTNLPPHPRARGRPCPHTLLTLNLLRM
jgi:hypothetical protein